jgi:hypothetical protein
MKTRRAATLIELLVVIALIGLLIALLIPSLKRSMELASATICKHNLREIYHSLHTYRMDNDGWLPAVVRPSSLLEPIKQPEPWFLKLYPHYLSNPELLACPEDPYGYRMERASRQSDFLNVVRPDYASYGLNSFIMTAGRGRLANADRVAPTRPHDTMLVADLGPDRLLGASPARVVGTVGPIRNYSLLSLDDGFDPYRGRPADPWVTERHYGGIHMVTLTGAVRDAETASMFHRPMRVYYEDCAAGGCTLCNELRVVHFSFAKDHLYWWTGPAPTE